MADINNIKNIAKKLGLNYIADGVVDLSNETLSNADYLEAVLKKELDFRLEARSERLRRRSKLPHKTFAPDMLSRGLKWQLDQLETMNWIEDSQNLLIIGKCGIGKTSLAVYLAEKAIENDYQTYYVTAETFIGIMRNHERQYGADSFFAYLRRSDLIVLDELFYTDYTAEELRLLYKGLMFLNETRSFIFISNREVSSWRDSSSDLHVLETLSDRILVGCQLFRF